MSLTNDGDGLEQPAFYAAVCAQMVEHNRLQREMLAEIKKSQVRLDNMMVMNCENLEMTREFLRIRKMEHEWEFKKRERKSSRKQNFLRRLGELEVTETPDEEGGVDA